MTLLSCVCHLMPLSTTTSSWVHCLPLARSCPTTTPATSPDGVAPRVSPTFSYALHIQYGSNMFYTIIKGLITWVGTGSPVVFSWRSAVCPAEAGLPARRCPRHLLQLWMVGQHCEELHGLWWWR